MCFFPKIVQIVIMEIIKIISNFNFVLLCKSCDKNGNNVLPTLILRCNKFARELA